jgi:RNAse (barnase) inhibitor barstar
MRELVLDAATWQSENDFYDAFFHAVGAPSWYGRNLNALNDSIGAGEINEIEVPYRLIVRNVDGAGQEAKAIVGWFKEVNCQLVETGCPVELCIKERSGSES